MDHIFTEMNSMKLKYLWKTEW